MKSTTDPITYTDSLTGITPAHLQGFFVGWPTAPTPSQHLRSLQQSDHIWLARLNSPADLDAPVVGFINALTDGVISAFIPLLEVLPAYQYQGIGQTLVQRMLRTLNTLYAIDLICDTDLQPFYARQGAQPWTGMIWRRPDRLAAPPGSDTRG